MLLENFPILCINLAKRVDRWRYMERQFLDMGLGEQVYRVEAVDGQALTEEAVAELRKRFRILPTVREDRLRGRMGCYLSHLAALEQAMAEGWERVLIIEDDCEFLTGATERPIQAPLDCEVFYLGGTFWRQKEAETAEQTGPWVHIERRHLKMAGTFALGLEGRDTIRRVYQMLCEARPSSIDLMYINEIQKRGHCYIMNPVMCRQCDGLGSDVSHIGAPPPRYVRQRGAFFYTEEQERAYEETRSC